MLRSVNLALMEAENMKRRAERAAPPAQHALAVWYDDWRNAREISAPPRNSIQASLNGDDEC